MVMFFVLMLSGCTAEDVDSGAPAYDQDMRLSEADLPALEPNQEIWWGPEVVVEPYSEVMHCLFGTYTGEDIGLASLQFWQGAYGHHLQLFGTSTNPLDIADGEVIDCTDSANESMTSLEPLLIADSFNGEVFEEMVIPDGMAYKLREGQRWVLQAHYVNTSDQRILVRDPAVLNFIEVDEVETWVAPLVINHGDFSIPAGEELTSSFECTYEEDYQLLYLLGHMHEWGTSMKLELTLDEQTETIYEIEEWDPVYRDDPPVNGYADDPFELKAGSSLKVTCTWENTLSETLGFPNEMCVGVTMAYPALTDSVCSD